jgi:alcohol dehydrogenase
MAYAALLSGITLAQVGLGSVHGLAAPLGAFFPIPHGVVCGTLLEAATRVNVAAMAARDPGHPALEKYARVGRLLNGMRHMDQGAAHGGLLLVLKEWTRRFGLPRLGEFGVSEADLPRIVANCRGSSMKTNPVVLSDEEVGLILKDRL